MRKFIISFAAAASVLTAGAAANAQTVDGSPYMQLAQYNGGYNSYNSYNYKDSRDALDTCRYC